MEPTKSVKAEDQLQALINLKGGVGFKVTVTMEFWAETMRPEDAERLGKEWFADYNKSHAYRDNSKIGYSDNVTQWTIVTKN